MTDLVEQTLNDIGPCVSTRLVEALVKDHGLTPEAARKRVSRSTSIKKLAYLKFPRNARFVYLQSDYASPEFWDALVRALLEETIAYGGGLAALLARGGIMLQAHFSIACGAPLAQKRHLSPAAILDRLKEAKLVQTVDIPGLGPCIELSNQLAPEPQEVIRMRARLRTEEILLCAVKDWARKLGLVSYDKVAIRDEDADGNQPRVGTLNWDLTAPSYLAPMLQWSDDSPKPGFLACDVLLGVVVKAEYLRPFLGKCETLRSLKNVGRCLQIFVADGYEGDAFALAKKEGVIPATTESLFGEEVARSLAKLSDLLQEVYPRADNVDKLEEIFSRLSKIEGAAINLRGALFEYVAAELVRSTSTFSDIRMNQIFRDENGKSAEVDVLAIHHNKSVRFIECKGYKPGGTVPDEQVTRWLEDRIPLVRRAALAETFWRGHRLDFEFWTTGKLSSEAQELVTKAQQSIRAGKYSIKVVASDALHELGKTSQNPSLKKTLDEHFLCHPMETAERDVEKRQRRQRLRAKGMVPRQKPEEDMPDVGTDVDFANAGVRSSA